MLFESYRHQSVFFKIVLSCWEHVIISLLGPNPNCTLGSVTKSSLLLMSQNVYFSIQFYKQLLCRLDGLGLCQVIDKTLLKIAVYTLERNVIFLNVSQTTFKRPINKIRFSIRSESVTGNNCCSDFMFICGYRGYICAFLQNKNVLRHSRSALGFLLLFYHISFTWCSDPAFWGSTQS